MAGLFYLKASKKKEDTQHVARFKYFGGSPPKKEITKITKNEESA